VLKIFVDKNWSNEVKKLAIEIDKAIKQNNFTIAKEYIQRLNETTKSGDPAVRRDALIAIDYIMKRYGSMEPSNFVLPDWKGDFRAIRKRATILHRTKNILEMKQLIRTMNQVIKTNQNADIKKDATELLLYIAELDKHYIEEYLSTYIEAFVSNSEKDLRKHLHELMRIIDPTFPEDINDTLRVISEKEKIIKIKPKYNYFNDFIQYKVQIYNNTDQSIWDVRYKIMKYEENFILRSIKPEIYKVFEENLVFLGVLQPNDMKEILFEVEPRKSQLFLDGRVYYKKYNSNDFEYLDAPNIVVDILGQFPVLEPDAKVSIIYCREFFDYRAKFKSLNVFALPTSITPELAYNVGKRILTDLKFSFIMEIVEKENFFGEAIFYGSSKLKLAEPILDIKERIEEIVIVLRCSHENYALEINVGCNYNPFLIAIQIQFDNLLRQILGSQSNMTENDKILELRCPSCFQPYEKLERDWCPWCGADIDKSKLF